MTPTRLDSSTAGTIGPNLADRLVALLLHGLARVAGALPRPLLLTLARGGAPVLAPFVPATVIRKNLRILRSIDPDCWQGRCEDEMVIETVRHQLYTLADFLHLVARRPERILEHVRLEGWERLEAVLAKGRGAILVSSHLGNWELAGALVAARGVRIHAFYHEQLSPAFDAFLAWARRRSGLGVLHQRRGLRECLRALREGGAIGFVADQDGSRDGVFLDFLGRLVSFPRGPYEFARHAGCEILAVECRRLPDGDYGLCFGDPFVVDSIDAVEPAARRLASAFETAILAEPAQWQLFYDRFWLRHIPRLEALGLLERARMEFERDRSLEAPDSPPPLPGPRLTAGQFLGMAGWFYTPVLLLSLGWMAFRQALPGRLLWSGSALAALGPALLLALATIVLSRWICFNWRRGREMAQLLGQLLTPLTGTNAVQLAALSAAAEEALFRGALQPEIGLVPASLLFGIVHFPAEPRLRTWTAFAMAMGFALGGLYAATGGLAAPVLAHFLINAVNLAWLAPADRQSGGNAES